jgi:Uncharacterised protein family (UPF0158)
MPHKRLPIEWSDLEMALTWRSDEGGQHYLDVTTGEIHGFTAVNDEWTEDDIDAALAEKRLIPIETLPSSVEYGWMEDFAASVANATLRRLLDVALDGSGVFRRFKDALCAFPAERERWFAFRQERLRETMREWLEDHGIAAAGEGPRQ